MAEFHDDQTIQKVLNALIGTDQNGDVEMHLEEATDAINRMSDAGILFRELNDEEIVDETTTSVEYELMQPVSKDEYIRLECLNFATQTIPLNRTGNEGQFIERARYFEQYVRSGAFEKEKK